MITFQSIFDKAWQAFIVEDQPPAAQVVYTGTNGAVISECAYLTEDGRRCAIGLSLTEFPEIEGYRGNFSDLVDSDFKIPWADEILEAHYFTLDSFQCDLHDELCDKGEWKFSNAEREAAYRAVAEELNLTIPGES